MSKSYNVAVVGATGIVGQELLTILVKRGFPVRSLKLLASPRSAGKKIPFGEQDIEVEVLSHNSFEGCDLVFNAIPDETSKEYSPSAVKAGAIVMVSSIAAHTASNLSSAAYTAAKTGMVGFARHLAKEVGPSGIRVNTVAPGIIASERVAKKYESYSADERKALLARIPLGRIGRVEEVAAVIAFLASEEASYIHGALIDINGGLFMD